MTARKVFHHVLASDLQPGDLAVIKHPGYDRDPVCRCLLTVVSVGAQFNLARVIGKTETRGARTFLLDPDQLVAVAMNPDVRCKAKDSNKVRCELPSGHEGRHDCAKALENWSR